VTVSGINRSAVRFKRRRPGRRRRAILRLLLATCRAKLVVKRHVARLPYKVTFPYRTISWHSVFEVHSSSAFFQERCVASENTVNFELLPFA
jgi:hypothetical protein